ncbi:MAG: hypothetical protein IT168_23420 [Bryobacterales bacterium]|nr:hypothetical protein [Bryobacterales bacterium]
MKIRYLIASGSFALAALAWQDSFATLKLTREVFEKGIRSYVYSMAGDSGGEPRLPWAGRTVTGAFLALNDSGRAAAVKELGATAKSLVMSPAFAAAYDEYLKTSHNAVNHGVKPVADASAAMNAAAASGNVEAMDAATNNMMRDTFRKMVQQKIPQIGTFDAQTIGFMVDADVSMIEMATPSSAAEKANVAKAKTMLAEVKKTAPADINKARATYKSALLLAAGLKDEAAVASANSDDKKQEQQRNYDRLRLKPVLKQKLQRFIAIGKTVDFKAATQAKGNKLVFVNPADERRAPLWKLLYRAGPGATNAALAIAQSWASEL